MGEGSHHRSTIIVEFKGDIDRIFGHRHEKHIFKTACRVLWFVIAEPLLEQRRERLPINLPFGSMMAHNDLPITFHRNFGKPLSLAIPARGAIEFVECDVLLVHIARERVIDAQRGIVEIIIKLLCMDLQPQHANQKE